MNQQDRKVVAEKLAKLVSLKEEAEFIGLELQELAASEQEKFDNLPEGFQQGDKGQIIEHAAIQLSNASDAMDSGDLGAAIEALEAIE